MRYIILSAVRALMLCVVATLSACSPITTKYANRAGIAITTLSLAADWCQTRSAASSNWIGYSEGGMVASRTIGTTPSTEAVDAYFAIGTLVILGAAQLIPERYRPLAYVAVTAVQVSTVAGNLETTNCIGLGR